MASNDFNRTMDFRNSLDSNPARKLLTRVENLPQFTSKSKNELKQAFGSMIKLVDQKAQDSSRYEMPVIHAVTNGCQVLTDSEKNERDAHQMKIDLDKVRRDLDKVMRDLDKVMRKQDEKENRKIMADLVNDFEATFFWQYQRDNHIEKPDFIRSLEDERIQLHKELNKDWEQGDPLIQLQLDCRAHQDLLAAKQYHRALFDYYKKFFTSDNSSDEPWRVVFELRRLVAFRNEESHIAFSGTSDEQKQARIREYRRDLEPDNIVMKSLLDALDKQIAARIQFKKSRAAFTQTQ